MAKSLHLGRRLFTSLARGAPTPVEEQRVAGLLSPAELDLWRRMSGPDRRHASEVERRAAESYGPDGIVSAAALLHDVGKVGSGLGTIGRVPPTVLGLAGARRWARRWEPLPGLAGKWARYLRHGPIGAQMLEEAGSHAMVVAWAREHHLPRSSWTLPAPVAAALETADDD